GVRGAGPLLRAEGAVQRRDQGAVAGVAGAARGRLGAAGGVLSPGALLRGAGASGRGAGRLRARVRSGHQLPGRRRAAGTALTIGSARVSLAAAFTPINARESMLRTALPKLVQIQRPVRARLEEV